MTTEKRLREFLDDEAEEEEYEECEEEEREGGRRRKKKYKKPTYRQNAKQFFLTYAQCDISPQEMLEFLSKRELEEYVISQEKHQDGGLHIHAYIMGKKKWNFNTPTYFDYKGFHPKIEKVKSRLNVIRYVVKDNVYITNLDDKTIKKIIESGEKVGEIHKRARTVAREEGIEAALEVLEHTKTARDLTLHGETIKQNLEALVKKDEDIREYTLGDFNLDFEWDRSKTLIISGPTNLGKTCLARALLPKGLFANSIEGLRDYNPRNYEGFILDDPSLKRIIDDRDAQLALVDVKYKRCIEARYKEIVIPAGTPRIITTNHTPETLLPFLMVHGVLDEAIERRIQRYNMTHRMFATHRLPVNDATASAIASTVVANDLQDDIDWGDELIAHLNSSSEFTRGGI